MVKRMVFSSSRKLAQQTARRLMAGHITLITWWTLRHSGVLEAIIKMEEREGEGLNPLVYATRTNMAPEVLAAMLEYLATEGLVSVSEGLVRLTPEGRALYDHEDGVLQLVRAYGPVLDAAEHLLAKLKTAGPGGVLQRKADSYAESQAQRYAGEVFPAVQELVAQGRFSHLLDVSCGAGDLLVHVARGLREVVGVGIGEDAFLVRRANAAITEADLERRLIAVAANPLEVCTDTQRTFDRIGISRQLWNSIDCVVAMTVFSDLAVREGNGAGAVSKALAGVARAFPKAHLMLVEPVASPRFERNYYAAELALLLRLSKMVPWPPEKWRETIAVGRLTLVQEIGLTTDGLTIFLCKPGTA